MFVLQRLSHYSGDCSYRSKYFNNEGAFSSATSRDLCKARKAKKGVQVLPRNAVVVELEDR